PRVVEGPVTQMVITHNAAYQANDLDAYDSDCDDLSIAKAILMTNLSSYGSDVLSEETNMISIADSKETLMLEEESQSKMRLKQSDPMRFVPQQVLSDEQAFRSQTLHPNTDQSASSPVRIEAPRELPKITPDALTEGKWGFEHAKAFLIETYKQIYDSIKPSRVRAKNMLNHCIKNDLRKIKGKDIVDNAAQVSKATTITPRMYNLDLVTLALKDKNNRKTHIYYLKHTIEQAAIIREIVEQAKSLNSLDSASYSACKYVKLIQELLGYVRDICSDIHKPSEKLVAVTPIKKTIRLKKAQEKDKIGSKPDKNGKRGKAKKCQK
nr:hypothetical protein [Tanacetum cinerariifolium]